MRTAAEWRQDYEAQTEPNFEPVWEENAKVFDRIIRATQLDALKEYMQRAEDAGGNPGSWHVMNQLRAEIEGEGEREKPQPLYVRLDSIPEGAVFEFAPEGVQPEKFYEGINFAGLFTRKEPTQGGDRFYALRHEDSNRTNYHGGRLVRVVEWPKEELKPEPQRIRTTYGQLKDGDEFECGNINRSHRSCAGHTYKKGKTLLFADADPVILLRPAPKLVVAINLRSGACFTFRGEKCVRTSAANIEYYRLSDMILRVLPGDTLVEVEG